MFESIPAFSIVLGSDGAKFSREEEEKRKQVIREEIKVLIPASKHLLHSALKEYVVAEGGKIVLTYDLVESPQLNIEFDVTDTSNAKQIPPIVVRLVDDLHRLRDSAEFTQIRLLELAQLSTALVAGGTDNRGNSMEKLSEEDKDLWVLMHSKSGNVRRISFLDRDVYFQIPLFPAFVPEEFTRRIHALVTSISPNKAALKSVVEVGDTNSNVNSNRPSIRKNSIDIHRPIDKTKDYFWPLLFAAMDYRIPVEADVRVALHIGSLAPGYLELHDLVNAEQLKIKFDSLHSCIKQGT